MKQRRPLFLAAILAALGCSGGPDGGKGGEVSPDSGEPAGDGGSTTGDGGSTTGDGGSGTGGDTATDTGDPCAALDLPLPVDDSPLVGIYSGAAYRFLEDTDGQVWHLGFGSEAIRSVAGTAPPDGSYGQTEFEASPGTTAAKLVSIAPCAGDFGSQAGSTLDAGCLVSIPVVAGTIYWKTPGAEPPVEEDIPGLYACVLEPGRTYHLNLVHASDPADLAGSATCPEGEDCTFAIVNRNTVAEGR